MQKARHAKARTSRSGLSLEVDGGEAAGSLIARVPKASTLTAMLKHNLSAGLRAFWNSTKRMIQNIERLDSSLAHIRFGKPVSTFPGYALGPWMRSAVHFQ
jgi:hypothetical protein